uniref:Uncharacterized protein n=1 Tax=Cacopsylla melanoneura TaxID=428564 RepID=A0A8D9DSI0_9HEMI
MRQCLPLLYLLSNLSPHHHPVNLPNNNCSHPNPSQSLVSHRLRRISRRRRKNRHQTQFQKKCRQTKSSAKPKLRRSSTASYLSATPRTVAPPVPAPMRAPRALARD